MSDYCEFKKFCDRDEWIFGGSGSGKFKNPDYGQRSGSHPLVRCPLCNKRLHLKAGYCVGGEFSIWILPEHKPKEKTKKKSPNRKTKGGGRGK